MSDTLYQITVKDATLSSFVNGQMVIVGCVTEMMPIQNRQNALFYMPEVQNVTLTDLCTGFMDRVKPTLNKKDFGHCRIIVNDFLSKTYGDTPVDSFKPSCLKRVRSAMIQSGRFCRKLINKYARQIVAMFAWGVEEEWVRESTWQSLKAVKSLRKGEEGTYDNPPRKEVPDNVVQRTLPFMPPTIRAMVQVQRLTGMRPGEVYNMRVGEIDRTRCPEIWYYTPAHHKTERFIGAKTIPLGKPEQKLIAPYLIGKKASEAVFSPRTAMAERNAELRAKRQSKITPSQTARNEARASKTSRYNEFYIAGSYSRAIKNVIQRANRQLPEGEQIPYWHPYQLRHSASTAAELAGSIDDAQALLGHRTPDTSRRYSHGQLVKAEKLARERRNPFDTDGLEGERAVG